MNKCFLFFLMSGSLLLATGCSTTLKIGHGANDSKPLVFEEHYEIEQIPTMTVDGRAFWGIPSFKSNNQNKRDQGRLRHFIEPGGFRIKRILPVLTLFFGSLTTHAVLGEYLGVDFMYDRPVLSWTLLSLPIMGTVNNALWEGAAYSGSVETMQYRLLNEYPDVDVFVYPKYHLEYDRIFDPEGFQPEYLWIQKARLQVDVKGATLKTKE